MLQVRVARTLLESALSPGHGLLALCHPLDHRLFGLHFKSVDVVPIHIWRIVIEPKGVGSLASLTSST